MVAALKHVYNHALAASMAARVRPGIGLVVGLVSVAAVVLAGDATTSGDASAQTASAAPTRRALLIGVTEFRQPKLKARSLRGPANDVELFRDVLERAPLSIPAANIRMLKGGDADPRRRPTFANIEREFTELATVSRKGDQIVILMAGHGSQQPADRDPTDDEPDGLDEIFLPEDVEGWDGTIGRVKNAVVDDTIRAWVSRIRNSGAFVWLIFDSCQSGTMARGVEVERQVPMSELVPAAAITEAQQRASRRGTENGAVGLLDSAGDVAALYAAHMTETTPEKPLPNPESPVHGLFTYTIADILSQSATALTYRELALRVLERYRSMPRYSPTPMFEGGGLDQQILGQQIWPERPQMLLGTQTSSGSWTLRAGSLHGLTAGSILEVFPPAGSSGADIRIGYVKVTAVEPMKAQVVPTAFDNVPAPTAGSLILASRARVRHYEFGDFRVKVGVQVASGPRGAPPSYSTVAPGRGPAVLERALTDLPKTTNGLAERVTGPAADWFVRVIDGKVVLTPSEEWRATAVGQDASSAVPQQFVIGRITEATVAQDLTDALRRIGRARNLMRLAGSAGAGLPLDLTLVRYPSPTQGVGRPLFSKPGDVVMRAGEFAEFRIRNRADRPVDVTLLYVDAGMGIQPLFPLRDREIDNQVKPGEERIVGRFPVTDMPLGWEAVVAIGVESTMTRQNFTMLAQESLDTRRGESTVPLSPLHQLLERAMFGSGVRTRGMDVNAQTFAVKLVTWRTDKAGKQAD